MSKQVMDKEEIKYDAFISYKHSERDSYIAESIHKQLEHYHIPKSVQQMTGRVCITMAKHLDNKKPVVEYTAKITLPNGEIIERTVSTEGAFPSLEDFNLSSREGFLQDFDLLEKTVLETSRKLNGELSREYLEASSKKTGSESKGDFIGCGIRPHQVSCAWQVC